MCVLGAGTMTSGIKNSEQTQTFSGLRSGVLYCVGDSPPEIFEPKYCPQTGHKCKRDCVCYNEGKACDYKLSLLRGDNSHYRNIDNLLLFDKKKPEDIFNMFKKDESSPNHTLQSHPKELGVEHLPEKAIPETREDALREGSSLHPNIDISPSSLFLEHNENSQLQEIHDFLDSNEEKGVDSEE